MILIVSRRKSDKEYLYFTKGSKRLYLGSPTEPKEERIKEAIQHLYSQIKNYENEVQKLNAFLPKKMQEFNNIIYKLIIFDLDGVIYDKPWNETNSTEVAVSTWDVLFQEMGFYNVHEKLKQNYVNKIYKSYTEWSEAACNNLKSLCLDRKTFEKILNQRSLIQGAKDVFQILQKNKIVTAIITGSFEDLAQRATKELGGINHIFAHCKLHFNNRGLLESWKLHPTDYEDKALFVKQIAKKHNIPLKQCAYIGDDVNDITAFKEVGLSIAFNTNKPKVRQAAKVVIESRDLKSILPHLLEYK